jgi:hypothetical protein
VLLQDVKTCSSQKHGYQNFLALPSSSFESAEDIAAWQRLPVQVRNEENDCHDEVQDADLGLHAKDFSLIRKTAKLKGAAFVSFWLLADGALRDFAYKLFCAFERFLR